MFDNLTDRLSNSFKAIQGKNKLSENNIKEAIFLDDVIEHLETVKDSRVRCLFADWGYGVNSNYELYQWDESI